MVVFTTGYVPLVPRCCLKQKSNHLQWNSNWSCQFRNCHVTVLARAYKVW